MSTLSAHGAMWDLDPEIHHLNHGSFGAVTRELHERRMELLGELGRDTLGFFLRRYQDALDGSREVLAGFLGADLDGLVFVPNATHGVNAALRSLQLEPGDEVVTTNHGYGACVKALAWVAYEAGAKMRVAEIPTPLQGPEDILEVVLAEVGPRTRLVMLDHVTSPTAIVFPVERLVQELTERGIATLIDGAHAPGMLPLDLRELGATFYTGNCHKWVCAPHGAAFFYVHPDQRARVHAPIISHGRGFQGSGRTDMHLEFDWIGTIDPTPWLLVGEAIEVLETAVGWEEIRAHNRGLALQARAELMARPGFEPICPPEMLGSMVAMRVAPGPEEPPDAILFERAAQKWLFDAHHIRVPILVWASMRLIRVSAHLYNQRASYRHLAEVWEHRPGA